MIVTKERKELLSFVLIAVLVFAFFVCATLFIFIRSNVFPIINGVILTLFLFLFRGKYRAYAFIFFSSFTKCMMIINTKIGSFLTWNMLAYIIVVLTERIITKKKLSPKETKLAITYLAFVAFAFLTDLINIKNVSLFKFASAISYLSIPIILTLDTKADKNIKKLLLSFSLSIVLMNLFAFVFVYIFKQYTDAFLNTYLPKHIVQINYYQNNYRFSGLTGDPNHNALYISIAVSLNLIYLFKAKEKFVAFHILNVVMIVFGLVGQSKTFFLSLMAGFLVLMADIIKHKKKITLAVFATIGVLVVGLLLCISIPFLSNILFRFINIDIRTGFLESLTTQRLHIWKNYLSYFSQDPIRIIFGHGVWPTLKLFDWDYHNFYIQLFWEFGLIGSCLFFIYARPYIMPKSQAKRPAFYLPTVLLLLFSLSLHILYDEFIYSGLYIYNYLLEELEDKSSSKTESREAEQYYELEI